VGIAGYVGRGFIQDLFKSSGLKQAVMNLGEKDEAKAYEVNEAETKEEAKEKQEVGDTTEEKMEEQQNKIITDYDRILYEDSNYTIVAKKETGFDKMSVKVGVLNGQKTEWIYMPSSMHIFLEPDGWGSTAVWINEDSSSSNFGQIMAHEISYIGDGMFVSRAGMSANNEVTYLVFYNVDKDEGFMMAAAPITYSYFGNKALGRNHLIRYEDERAIVIDDNDKIYSINTSGNKYSTGLSVKYNVSVGKYSCGVFFCGDGFYDKSGNCLIDLSYYEDQIYEYYGWSGGPYFTSKDSTVKVYMIGADNETYYMEVDFLGNFITQSPVKANSK